VAGTVTASGSQLTSDRRWKTNIADVASCLDSVLALRPVYYDWREDSPMAMARNTSAPGVSPWPRQLGFVAQEVQDALPRRGEGVVHEVDDAGHLGVSYSKLTALLAGAVQEQQATIDELKQASEREIAKLKAQQQASEREAAELKAQQEAMRTEHEAMRLVVEQLLAASGR